MACPRGVDAVSDVGMKGVAGACPGWLEEGVVQEEEAVSRWWREMFPVGRPVGKRMRKGWAGRQAAALKKVLRRA